jgi:hypothetical protein
MYTEPKFYEANGELTRYAMACGYIMRTERGADSVEFWMEHNTYHVRHHSTETGRVFWSVFDTIGKARRCYRKTAKKIEKL